MIFVSAKLQDGTILWQETMMESFMYEYLQYRLENDVSVPFLFNNAFLLFEPPEVVLELQHGRNAVLLALDLPPLPRLPGLGPLSVRSIRLVRHITVSCPVCHFKTSSRASPGARPNALAAREPPTYDVPYYLCAAHCAKATKHSPPAQAGVL